MKILDDVEIPLPLMEVFTDWCNITNYPIIPESFKHFANDCFINYVENYTNFTIECELDDNDNGLVYDCPYLEIHGYLLYSEGREEDGIYIEMKNKLDEIKRTINT